MFVEFIGLPASGKTTLYRAMHGAATAEGLVFHDVKSLDDAQTDVPKIIRRNPTSRALYWQTRFAEEHPECAQMIDQIGAKHIIAKTLLTAVCIRHGIHDSLDSPATLYCTDEGMLHRAVHLIQSEEDNESILDRFCRYMPLPDLLVVARVSPETAYARAKERFAARRNCEPDHRWVTHRMLQTHGTFADFEMRDRLMATARKILDTRGCMSIECDTNEEPHQVAQRILEQIKALVVSRKAAA